MTYKPESNNADDVHKNVSSLSKYGCIKRDKWLRAAEREECLSIRLRVDSVRFTKHIQTRGCALTTQNKKRMTTAKPPIPLVTVLQKIPLAAARLAFFVSSATWPDASKPMRIPAVARYDKHQFQPAGAPVPLYVVINAS